jgi:hypothetical protein
MNERTHTDEEIPIVFPLRNSVLSRLTGLSLNLQHAQFNNGNARDSRGI